MSSHHRYAHLHLLDDPFFPFPPLSSSSTSCPFLSPPASSSTCPFFALDSPSPYSDPFDLHTFLPPPRTTPLFDPFLLHTLTDRVSQLELALAARAPQPTRRKCTYVTESAGRKVKWTTEDKPRGERVLKWEAELDSPYDDGFGRKWKWEAKAKTASAAATKLKWATHLKGKGCLEPWSHSYTWEEDFSATDDDDDDEIEDQLHHKALQDHSKLKTKAKDDKKKKKKDNNTVVVNKEQKKCPFSVKIEEIPPEDDNTAGCVAIRKLENNQPIDSSCFKCTFMLTILHFPPLIRSKAFALGNGKAKKKELSPQDAALLIQLNYRAHLAHRSQVLRCLRDLAVAKAKLKEIRSLFYNISYRHRMAHDHEERQRFTEKIIVLLLTVDALEGPDYMVRTAKKSMLDELEGMLEIVDPQPPGKQRSLTRRKFDLPEGGPITDEKMAGVNNAVKVIQKGKK
uniref:BAG domain-containing protein n=1 Tax=Oryza meridionalis TaxID=40149 RepID=A0A0E0DVH6_9ORYZ